MTSLIEIASAAAVLLSPYMPYLKEAGKLAGKKAIEAIGKKGGEAAWDKALSLWQAVKMSSGDSPELQSVATLVATNPADPTFQAALAKILCTVLEQHPELAEQLLHIMAGERSIQEVLAEHRGQISDVEQQLEGDGRQTVKAGGTSRIEGVTQVKQ